MKQITINVNPSIYEHIMFFLRSLPSNLVDIHLDNREKNLEKSKPKSLRGVFSTYADVEKQALEKDAWRDELLKKYKSSIND